MDKTVCLNCVNCYLKAVKYYCQLRDEPITEMEVRKTVICNDFMTREEVQREEVQISKRKVQSKEDENADTLNSEFCTLNLKIILPSHLCRNAVEVEVVIA